jgi:malate synthase
LLAAAQMKDELMECSDKISKRIDAYYKDFFGDNEELKEEIKKKPVRPELY